MSALIGLTVKTPTSCKCGREFAVVGASNDKYPATLTCPQCGTGRGVISSFTLDWLETLASKFGKPATITLRQVIPTGDAETVSSIAARP